MEPNAIYQVLEGHDRPELALYFAKVIKDYKKLVLLQLAEKKWPDAIKTLLMQVSA